MGPPAAAYEGGHDRLGVKPFRANSQLGRHELLGGRTGLRVVSGSPEAASRSEKTVVVAQWLVDEVEVDVVEAEPLERTLDRGPGLCLTGLLDPQLGGDEQLIAGDAAGGHGTANCFLVLIGGGCVEVAVADLQGGGNGPRGIYGRNLEDAEAEDGITTPLLSVTLGTFVIGMMQDNHVLALKGTPSIGVG